MNPLSFFILICFACLVAGIVWATLEYHYSVIFPVRREMKLGKCLVRVDHLLRKIQRARTPEDIRRILSNVVDFDTRYSTGLADNIRGPLTRKLFDALDARTQEIEAYRKKLNAPVQIGTTTIDDLLSSPKQT